METFADANQMNPFLSWEEEIATQTMTARAASPVFKTTAQTSGPGLLLILTAVPDRVSQ